MDNPEDWVKEQERMAQLKEEKKKDLPFGYDYIIEMLNEISINLTPHTLFNSGVMLGRLMQVIIANKDKE